MTFLDDIVAGSTLHWSDYIVLVVYFVVVIIVGIWVSDIKFSTILYLYIRLVLQCILIFSVPASVSSYFPHYTLQHTVGCTYTTLKNLDYFKYDLLVGRGNDCGQSDLPSLTYCLKRVKTIIVWTSE